MKIFKLSFLEETRASLEMGFEPEGDRGADHYASEEPEGISNCIDEQAHGLKAHAEVNAKSDPGK